MYCSSCGKSVADGTLFCEACGEPAGTSFEKRPIVGIAVGAVFGIIGILWSGATMFRFINGNQGSVAAALYQAFPSLQSTNFYGNSLQLFGNSALLIGVLLAFLRHPGGHKTIRITSYCTITALLLVFAASYVGVVDAAAWETVDGHTKSVLIGGLIGGIIGGLFQWGLVLFLFRKSRWP